MFFTLFLKECKQMLKCITYYVLIICIVLFYVSQLGEFKVIEKPKPGQENYGETYSKDEQVIMEKTIQTFAYEYVQNNFITYPIGFYKTITLNREKRSVMGDILEELTGKERLEIVGIITGFLESNVYKNEGNTVPVNSILKYDYFLILMKQADQLLGGGSSYSDTFLFTNARVPKTFDEAMQEYNDILAKDHLSGAYARIFSDYMVIVLSILPVFLAVTRGLRDRRSKASELIFSRKASSLHIIMSRYFSMLFMLLVPVILLSIFPTIECIYYGNSIRAEVDYMAFLKYTLGWLLPSIMISASVGMVLTELTDSAIAILAQGAWWFVSLFIGMPIIRGGYRWNLMPRHNIVGNYEVFQDNFHQLVTNRITYSLIALLLVAVSALLYEMKRKGKSIYKYRGKFHGKILSNRKVLSKV